MARSGHWRREAAGPFNLLQHELSRLVEEYLQTGRYGGAEPAPTDLDPSAWTPAVDVYDTPEEVIVVAEVPGVDPATIDLAVTGNLLTLRGLKETNGFPEALPSNPRATGRCVSPPAHALQRGRLRQGTS